MLAQSGQLVQIARLHGLCHARFDRYQDISSNVTFFIQS